MAVTSAQRVAAYRLRHKVFGGEDATRRKTPKRAAGRKRAKDKAAQAWRERPFCGCDGEGAGTDDLGRQHYMLFRMGDRELYTGAPLSTDEILRFICAHPPNQLLVGFAFGYDVTMILRDLSEERARRLFQPRVFGPGHSPFVWVGDEFDVEYLPRQYFRVRRVRYGGIDPETGWPRRIVVKGSTRTIWEVFGFFQKSFVRVLTEFDVGTPAQRAAIAADKARRGGDSWEISERERAYCALECDLLAQLMEKLRGYCFAADIRPKAWAGAGRLAAALHDKHGTIRAKEVEEIVPPGVIEYANMAYYGGRFEITRTGMIGKRVWEYDINSAYPATMHDLPCLLHGRWRFGPCDQLPASQIACCGVRFGRSGAAAPGLLGGLPVRTQDGRLVWPWRGGGVYWTSEIRAAERLGVKCKLGDGWIYERRCDCRPFAWVETLYDYRRSIGSAGPGYPIKLGVAALYGKLAQRKGSGAFNNLVWAGLITAMTRAQLLDAVALASPGAIVMLATDGVYSTEPLALDLGEGLGQWGCKQLDELFIVQPGLYWDAGRAKRKARGLPGRFFEEGNFTDEFERIWDAFRSAGGVGKPPSYRVPVPGFVGLRLALSRNDHGSAGRWTDDHRDISFDWSNKRNAGCWDGGAFVTKPKLGAYDQLSLPHRDFLKAGGAEPWEAARLELEEQPDFIDLGPPWSE